MSIRSLLSSAESRRLRRAALHRWLRRWGVFLLVVACAVMAGAATIDLVHDRASRAAGEKLRCPLLALWGAKGKIATWYDALAIWRDYAAGPVEGGAVASGHYLAEEAPEEILGRLATFL